MEKLAISKFKATCLAVLERVRKTRKPLQITRFGEPIAEVFPPALPKRSKGWMGSLAGSGRIAGDIISPTAEEGDWDALEK